MVATFRHWTWLLEDDAMSTDPIPRIKAGV
jgi:hypothetical protein